MQREVLQQRVHTWRLTGKNHIVAKNVQGFFKEGLKERDIKTPVMKDEPKTLEKAYQKALSELKWKIRLDARAKNDEPMEICHSRR